MEKIETRRGPGGRSVKLPMSVQKEGGNINLTVGAAQLKPNKNESGFNLENSRLREQLAAAVEALDEVDTLASGNRTGCGTCVSVLREIAKVKEGK